MRRWHIWSEPIKVLHLPPLVHIRLKTSSLNGYKPIASVKYPSSLTNHDTHNFALLHLFHRNTLERPTVADRMHCCQCNNKEIAAEPIGQ
jgi:hypothetical protein